MQKRAREVLVGNDVQDYLLEIIEATRKHELIEIGVSPRGTLAFMRAIQARAILNEKMTVTPDDSKNNLLLHICAHRFNVND
ncbi:AAA family ATPase [Bacillus pacificus]